MNTGLLLGGAGVLALLLLSSSKAKPKPSTIPIAGAPPGGKIYYRYWTYDPINFGAKKYKLFDKNMGSQFKDPATGITWTFDKNTLGETQPEGKEYKYWTRDDKVSPQRSPIYVKTNKNVGPSYLDPQGVTWYNNDNLHLYWTRDTRYNNGKTYFQTSATYRGSLFFGAINGKEAVWAEASNYDFPEDASEVPTLLCDQAPCVGNYLYTTIAGRTKVFRDYQGKVYWDHDEATRWYFKAMTPAAPSDLLTSVSGMKRTLQRKV